MNQLSKSSSSEEIKMYFNAILRLSKASEKYPVNLDEVWMLVYTRRDSAIDALKRDFIENDDFITVRNSPDGGKFATVDYSLTVSCLEYFIVKRCVQFLKFIAKSFTKHLK